MVDWAGGAYAVFVLVFEGVYLGLMQPSFEKAECQGLTQAQRRARGDCGIPMIQLSIESSDQTRQTTMLARLEMDDGVTSRRIIGRGGGTRSAGSW